jgi:hypothetical protein
MAKRASVATPDGNLVPVFNDGDYLGFDILSASNVLGGCRWKSSARSLSAHGLVTKCSDSFTLACRALTLEDNLSSFRLV